MIVGLIKTANLHGSLTTSCFDFRPHALTNIKLAIDGSVYPNPLGITVDYTKGQGNGYLEGFQSLTEDSLLADCGLGGITIENYVNGFTLYRFTM